MIRLGWIVALLLLVSAAALAEDLSKLVGYAVVYGVSGPGPTQDLSKLIGYAVVTSGGGGGGATTRDRMDLGIN